MTLIVIISLSVLIIFYSKLNIKSENSKIIEDEFSNSSYDILKPKFTINNKKNKITITANQGDFLNKNEILLKNEVLFISKRFKISSDEVLFNKNNQGTIHYPGNFPSDFKIKGPVTIWSNQGTKMRIIYHARKEN